MKMFFFSNISWGECFTIMAPTIEIATQHLIAYLNEGEERSMKMYEELFRNHRDKEALLKQEQEKWQSLKDINNTYDIQVFEEGEILTTEYS